MGSDDSFELTDEQLDFLNESFDLARQGSEARLLAIIDAGIPVNLTDHKGDTLLALAAYNAHSGLVQGLLDRGADPNRVNERGQSALACALFVQDHDSVRALLHAGADPMAGAMDAWQIVDFFSLDAMRDLLPPQHQPEGPAAPAPTPQGAPGR
ncbi:ankyrin repeat domain-containing protein [Luteococcus sp. Sow4_B9]|uniref:ankyrin repeat domain-containing protein n=1 Tax=Luteococcus sp. Sow4_B9 TaxID=3438792 RepID=UPI003F959872